MPDNKPDVTKDWAASQGQKSAASRQRMYAWICWLIAIAGELVGIYLLLNHKFDTGNANMPLLIGLLVGIAVFAMIGSVLWKAAYTHDPASRANAARSVVRSACGDCRRPISLLMR